MVWCTWFYHDQWSMENDKPFKMIRFNSRLSKQHRLNIYIYIYSVHLISKALLTASMATLLHGSICTGINGSGEN